MLRSGLKLAVLCLSFNVALGWGSVYQVDQAHSKVSFKVKHMLISNVTGYFKTFSGSFEMVDKQIRAIEGTVESASVDTDNDMRDDHLKKPDFFHTSQYPLIRFVMTGREGDRVVGNLTIRGVTKKISLEAVFGGEVDDPWGNHRAGIELRGEIDRNDFGVSYKSNDMMISNKVRMIVELEGIRR